MGPLTLAAVSKRIVILRGVRVILSAQLAELYQVEHRALIQAVKRNRSRFPADFMFQLKPGEQRFLRSQSVILETSVGRGRHAKYASYAFTEQGVAMLSNVLKSKRAVAVNIEIMRAFVRLRQWLISNKELAKKVAEIEQKFEGNFRVVFETLEQLMDAPAGPPKPQIGFGRGARQ